jgi:tRNA wybutosine-synthesizing protein 4
MSHFNKLKTPLRSVFEYPSLEAQRRRFSRLGWARVEVNSLWQVWTDDKWISATQRKKLDEVEPFDEWEEFALFASHYCVVIANNTVAMASEQAGDTVVLDQRLQQRYPGLSWRTYVGAGGKRRFGAVFKLHDDLGREVFANTFGIGTNNRLRSCDFYTMSMLPPYFKTPTLGPGSRVCHAIVDLGHWGSLLVGGRASPTMALRDCWHFSIERNRWSPADDLPVPLYRHALTRLGRSSMVLLVGGKSDASTIFDGCLLYRRGSSWTKCGISGSRYRPVFGATLVSLSEAGAGYDREEGREGGGVEDCDTVVFRGILAGGLLGDGTVARCPSRWELKVPRNGEPTITFEPISVSGDIEDLICRFASYSLPIEDKRLAILGGIKHDGIVPQDGELLIIDVSYSRLELVARCPLLEPNRPSNPSRPLLVGASVSLNDAGQIVTMGGGATVSRLNRTISESLR